MFGAGRRLDIRSKWQARIAVLAKLEIEQVCGDTLGESVNSDRPRPATLVGRNCYRFATER